MPWFGYKAYYLIRSHSFPCIELRITEVTGKVAYSLPLVSKDDIYGVPVMIKVKHRNYEYDGKLRTAADGILISVWGDGKAKQMDDDLPF